MEFDIPNVLLKLNVLQITTLINMEILNHSLKSLLENHLRTFWYLILISNFLKLFKSLIWDIKLITPTSRKYTHLKNKEVILIMPDYLIYQSDIGNTKRFQMDIKKLKFKLFKLGTFTLKVFVKKYGLKDEILSESNLIQSLPVKKLNVIS